MKFVYLALPLLGSLAIAQSLTEDNCQCPQVKCPSTDTFEGCRCVNLAELRCKRRCPNYTPAKFRICPLPQQPSTEPASSSPTPLATPSLPPILGFPTPALPLPEPAVPTSLADLPDLPLIPGCECEEMMCIQSFPDSCHCAYNIAKTCYDKCGGKSPGLNVCPPLDSLGGGFNFDGPVKRAAAPEPCPAPQKSTVPIPVNIPVNVPAPASALTAALSTGSASASTSAKCECEETFCIQAFPASCVCANRNKNACWKKCGGPKPAYQICTNPIPNSVTSEKPSATSTKSIATSTRTTPSSTATSRPGLTQICGGGRANTNNCATGYTCIDDPYRVGVDGYCGLACDQTGICVQEQLCGGFAGFRCQTQGQICVDDPRDDCSPNTGGADCGGVCIWPVASRQLYTNNTQS